MQSREIKLDPLFTDTFFAFKAEKELTAAASFPLPSSADELRLFLAGETDQSKSFKKGFADIIDDLAAWAKANGMDASPFERFKKNYLDYSGSDPQKNRLDFHIYHEGISMLSGIIREIKNNDLPLDARKDVIHNLLKGINVCGPGTFTNITNAFLELLSLSNIGIHLMKLRRSIAEQVVLELMKAQVGIYQGMEIHYVNGVLNRFGDALGIQMVEDGYVANCNPEILDQLFEGFKQIIPAKLNLEALITLESQEEAFTNLVAELESGKPEVYAEKAKKIQKALARFGLESLDKPFYLGDSSIIQLYGEYEDQVAVDWKAPYVIFLSLYSRLQRGGYLHLEEQEELFINEDKLKAWRLPDRSLQFAYVYVEKDGKMVSMPFIEYCVETLAKPEAPEREVLLASLKKLFLKNRIEIAIGIAQFLKSTFTQYNIKEYQLSYQTLFDLLPVLMVSRSGKINLDDFLQLHALLPKDYHDKCIRALAEKVGIYNTEELIEVLKKVPKAQRADFLMARGNAFLKSIIEDVEDDTQRFDVLEDILTSLLKDHRAAFLTILGDAFLKTIILNEDELIFILNEPSENQQAAFLTSLGSELSKSIIQNKDQLVKVLLKLNQDHWGVFLSSLGDEFLKKLINGMDAFRFVLKKIPENQRVVFLTALKASIQDDRRLLQILNELPENQQVDFLNELGTDFLKSIIKTGDGLHYILSGFSDSKRADFLTKLDADFLRSIILYEDQLIKILKSLPENQRANFLITLGDAFLKTIIRNENQLKDMLWVLPENQVVIFLTTHCDALLKALIKHSYQLDVVSSVLPYKGKNEFLIHFFNLYLENKETLDEVLDIFNSLSYEGSRFYEGDSKDEVKERKLAIRKMILDEVLKITRIDLLEAAYHHFYFSRHRDDTETREKINKFASKFFGEKSLLETASQKQIMSRIKELKSEKEKKEEKEVKSEMKKK